ncbi:restriction endonuclease subunit S [Coleofasciculus sp.]|uniref:restriction endonuclease subunit S n=1 Tax=Coleofasciculus sp. TaxID=3100458 RepID=UPI0039FA2AC7
MSTHKLSSDNYQVPEGYKKTDVGVIPENWEVSYLYEIAKKVTDGEHATPKRTTEGYYLLSARNIFNGFIDLTDVDFVGVSEYQRIRKRCNPEAGDVLISCSGTIGRVSVLPIGIDCVMVRSAALVKPDVNKIKNYFLQYILLHRNGQEQIAKKINQGAQANLFINNIETLKIPLPPLPEQSAIARALSDADTLIAALDKQLAKKRHIKTATMQQLLTGKKRLPGFGEGKGYKKTDVGVIPEDWEILKLREVIKSFQNGYAFSAQGYVSSGVPIITMAQIGLDGTFKFSDECVNFWSVYDFNKLQQYHVENGDVIISMTDVTPEKNLIGRMTIVRSNITALLNQRVGLLRVDINKVNSVFLTALSNQRRWREYSRAIASLGVQANIGTKDIKEGKLILPPIREQNAIAQVLTDIDTEIAALEKRRAKTQAIKQGMMQELLTGRTRLV